MSIGCHKRLCGNLCGTELSVPVGCNAFTYVDSGDFDWGIHPTLNVSEWHRYTMSLDKSKDELLLVIDDVLSANYSRAGLSSAAGAGVFSSSSAITLWIGMYASYRMEDDVG